LPERIMEQARQAAAALQRPVEEILSDLLVAVLPAMQDVPDDIGVFCPTPQKGSFQD
jgi:hypothetical protein